MSISGCLCFCEANYEILNEVWSTFFNYRGTCLVTQA